MAVITYTIPSGRIVHETKVDFSYRSVQKPIHIVQYDKQLPIIAVSLYVSDKTYTLPANMDVNVKFGKRDRTFVYKPVLGCNASRNIVYFEVDEQMSFLHGPANPILELSFVGGEEPQRAGSSSIAIEIDRNPIQETDIESSNEYVDLNKAVEDAQAAQAAAEEARDAAETAREGIDQIVEDIDDIIDRKANRYIDEPIAELNNHTLREVFEENNLHKINSYNTLNNHILNYNPPFIELTKYGTSINGFAMRSNEIINTEYGKKYYFNGRFKGNTSSNVFIDTQVIDGNSLNLGSLTPNYETYSILYTNTKTNNTNLYLGSRYYPNTEKLYIKDDYIFIDITYLGIDNLTVEQIDYWFNVHMQYKDDNGLKSTVDSLQALKEKDSEIELKVTTIEEAYRKSQSGELTATKQDIENISLGKDVAPAPLQVKVDGGLLEAKQLVVNGDFSNGRTGWSGQLGINITVTDGIIEWTNSASTNNGIQRSITFDNAKYYTIARVYTPGVYSFRSYTRPSKFDNLIAPTSTVAGWNIISAINPINTTDNLIFVGFIAAENITFKLDYIYVFNISTLIANKTYSPLYNKTFDLMSDAEIKAQMDLWVQNGTLPNDNVLAVGMNKRVRSVGRNLFDGILAQGYYSTTTGTFTSSTGSVSSLNPIRVSSGNNYFISYTGYNGTVAILCYDSNMTFISFISNGGITPANTSYIHFRIYNVTVGTNPINNAYVVQLEQGTVATPYVPYANTDLYLQSNKMGYRLPNGVADAIEYRNGKYYFVKRVQEYKLQASDILLYETSAFTNVDYLSINYTNITNYIFNGVGDSSPNRGTSILTTFSTPALTNFVDDLSFTTKHYANSEDIAVTFPKGTYANLAEAQTALAGTIIYYQLATPIETEILALGNAQGLAGGTVYIDDVMADSNLYTHRYDIENTAYPIKSLDRIVKINADGSQTELAVSSAIIAGDGLSFTHPNLVANDIVWVSYYYNVANLFKSNTFVTYNDSPFVQEAWNTPTLLNGWVNRGSSYATCQYYKNSLGEVIIKGSVQDGTSQTIFRLPEGYRPKENMRFVVANGVTFATIDIALNGYVTTSSQPSTGAYYINVTFSTN